MTVVALLYNIHIQRLTRRRVEITLVPTWLGRLLRRRVRQGVAYRDDDNDGETCWWWKATDRYVGTYVERYIEASPLTLVEDMTVEQLLLDEPERKRS